MCYALYFIIAQTLQFVKGGCGESYNLETVYGSYDYTYSVSSMTFGIDFTTYDMVVGGVMSSSDPFIYMVSE